MNKSNHKELISSAIDQEMTAIDVDALLHRLKGEEGEQIKATWEHYHLLGDVIRSDDLAVVFSPNFSDKFSVLLAAEPVLLAPQATVAQSDRAVKTKPDVATRKSAYWAITSVAATVMLGVLMAPQILPLLKTTGTPEIANAKVEQVDPFTTAGVKLASNANSSASAEANLNSNKDAEFASKLENQVEMLRDPRLDSYLLAHQKVSPSFDNGARYVQRANVVSSPDSKK